MKQITVEQIEELEGDISTFIDTGVAKLTRELRNKFQPVLIDILKHAYAGADTFIHLPDIEDCIDDELFFESDEAKQYFEGFIQKIQMDPGAEWGEGAFEHIVCTALLYDDANKGVSVKSELTPKERHKILLLKRQREAEATRKRIEDELKDIEKQLEKLCD